MSEKALTTRERTIVAALDLCEVLKRFIEEEGLEDICWLIALREMWSSAHNLAYLLSLADDSIIAHGMPAASRNPHDLPVLSQPFCSPALRAPRDISRDAFSRQKAFCRGRKHLEAASSPSMARPLYRTAIHGRPRGGPACCQLPCRIGSAARVPRRAAPSMRAAPYLPRSRPFRSPGPRASMPAVMGSLRPTLASVLLCAAASMPPMASTPRIVLPQNGGHRARLSASMSETGGHPCPPWESRSSIPVIEDRAAGISVKRRGGGYAEYGL